MMTESQYGLLLIASTGLHIGYFVIGFFCVIVFLYICQNARSPKWVKDNGLKYHPRSDSAFHKKFKQFPLFREGYSRCTKRRVFGILEDQFQVHFFDYEYSKGGVVRQTNRSSGLLVKTNLRDVAFSILPRDAIDEINAFLQSDGVRFDSSPFSEKYYVKSSDHHETRKWFSPKVIEYILTKRFNVEMEFCDGWVLVTWNQSKMFPNPIEFIRIVFGLLREMGLPVRGER